MPSEAPSRPPYDQLEQQVCDIVADTLRFDCSRVQPATRLIEDLNCDSLEIVEIMLALEERLGVSLPDTANDPIYKSIFTRPQFHMRDFAELVYLRWGTGWPGRDGRFRRHPDVPATPTSNGFTQLGGRFAQNEHDKQPLHETLGNNAQGCPMFRRRTDGMVCVQLPAAEVTIGCDGPEAMPDEQPAHRVALSAFLIDVEPVSTTAYARFLNTINVTDQTTLRQWFLIGEDDRRHIHQPLTCHDGQWQPQPGTETWPMILVSWYGAHAYGLWAHGRAWQHVREVEADHLPSEAQWEYAARGVQPQRYPWGDREPTSADARFGMHARGRTYALHDLPLAPVHAAMGVSPFGLRHMTGNIWHWCRDNFDADFYRSPMAGNLDAANGSTTGIRSERGGSWIGSANLLRCSYRRGRAPHARGRCLGFRCVSKG